ncbi:hypothetical protein ABPG75_002124 [Micractinium tetrahymenae]
MQGTDIVDLTSPDEAPPARKRRREADDAIDLAADEDEAEARRRIMEHARRVNQGRGIGSGDGPAGAPSVGAGQLQGIGGGAGSAAAPAQPESMPPPNRLLAELHAERMSRQAQRQAQQAAAPGSGGGQQVQQSGPQQPPPAQHPQHSAQQPAGSVEPARCSLLTWNVWFKEEVHLQARMAAIGDVIQAQRPTFVCLQEVTPRIHQLFSASPWWRDYSASPAPQGAPYFTLLLWSRGDVAGAGGYAEIPFENSCMGRDLKTVAGRVAGRSIRVATTHLESPIGWEQPFREARQAQLKAAASILGSAREEDVLLAGDMNWSPDDGVPPLPGGWCDAFVHLHGASGEQEGLTYDARANPMLKKGNRLRRRLDRIFCKLRRWRLEGLDLVGRQALPGLQWEGRPVLPSDHFGLLLRLRAAG